MLCDVCNKREAMVHLTEIINEKVTKLHLCEECAREKGEEMETHFGLTDLLSGLADLGVVQEASLKKEIKCASCGFTLADFRKVGRLGCPKCYDAFQAQLAPLLRRIHGQDRHIGKLPFKVSGGKLSEDAKELHSLKIKLQKAISLEEFEEAAALRDKIKKIEENIRKRKK